MDGAHERLLKDVIGGRMEGKRTRRRRRMKMLDNMRKTVLISRAERKDSRFDNYETCQPIIADHHRERGPGERERQCVRKCCNV